MSGRREGTQEGVKGHKEGAGEAENQQFTRRASENASLAGSVTGRPERKGKLPPPKSSHRQRL